MLECWACCLSQLDWQSVLEASSKQPVQGLLFLIFVLGYAPASSAFGLFPSTLHQLFFQ